MKRIVWMSCAALLMGAAGSAASAQESLQTVKELYAAAAYEDALAAVNKLQSGGSRREVEQYRVFSLTALGRHEEAQKAMEAMVRADPSYSLDPAETPPRVQEAFSKVQQKLLPVVAKQMYTDARAALDRKEREDAIAQFEKLLEVIDGAGPGAASLAELRVLAEGFLDLSRALPGPVAAGAAAPALPPAPDAAKVTASNNSAPVTPSGPPAPTSAATSRQGTGANVGTGSPAATRTPAATSAAPAVARASISVAGGSALESRPFPLSQELPQWAPTDALSRRSTFSGAVTVKIGVDGRVDSAEMTKPVHPTYDQILLRTARNWRYQPAMRNGEPVESELTVEVNLRPPQ
jgi:protein TonB